MKQRLHRLLRFLVLSAGLLGAGGLAGCKESTTETPEAPAAPSNLVANAVNETEIQLVWKDNSTSESSFRVKRLVVSNATFSAIADVGANSTQYSDKTLSRGVPAVYVVVAVDANGKESTSSNVAAATALYYPPTKPVLTLTPLTWGRAELRWTDSDRETQYRILKGTSKSSLAFLRTWPLNNLVYADTTLEPVSTTYYAVIADDLTGALSTSSDTVSVTTPTASIRVFGKLTDALKGVAIANTAVDVTVKNLTTNDSTVSQSTTDINGDYSSQVTIGTGVNHRFRVSIVSPVLYNYLREFDIGLRGQIGDKREDIVDFERFTFSENPVNTFQNNLKDRLSYLVSRHGAAQYTSDITWIHGWRSLDFPHNVFYSGRMNDSSRGVADRALARVEAKVGKTVYRKTTGSPSIGIQIDFGSPAATTLLDRSQDSNGNQQYCFKWRITMPTNASGFPLFDENALVHELQYIEVGTLSIADGAPISSPFSIHSGFGPPYGTMGASNDLTQTEADNLNILRNLPLTFNRRYLLYR